MTSTRTHSASVFPTWEHDVDFLRSRLRWLIRLRWVGMFGIFSIAILGALGFLKNSAWPLILSVAIVGAIYNCILYLLYKRQSRPLGKNAGSWQAFFDVLMLTLVLWGMGGMQSPFIAYYTFHIALAGIPGGPKATLTAALTTLVGAWFLMMVEQMPVLQIGAWNPPEIWDMRMHLFAFLTTIGAMTYIVLHGARSLRRRESSLVEAREQAAIEYQVLSNTLNEWDAGLEVVDENKEVIWRNQRAESIAPKLEGKVFGDQKNSWTCPGEEHGCEKDITGICPQEQMPDEPRKCRFHLCENGKEKVYEMLTFPLQSDGSLQGDQPLQDGESPIRMMNLYVDRTESVISEQQLLLAEKLASLGRIAQGVAHELNTPLASIQTLITDARSLLKSTDFASLPAHTIKDLDESAAMIQDETRRLGRITQSLLAGKDMVEAHIKTNVPLPALIERAQTLVFVGSPAESQVQIEHNIQVQTLRADPDKLVQILVNLIQNARDAVVGKENPMIVISAECQKDMVQICVVDNGIGIDPSISERLFEPFATTKPPGQGTGLGLYTSFALCQSMGGELSLQNQEQGGTIACVRLPQNT